MFNADNDNEATSFPQPQTKNCKTCGIDKPLNEFKPKKDGGLGVEAHCVECAKANKHAYYLANHEHINTKAAAWHKANPDKVKVARKKYAETHKEEQKVRALAWKAQNPEWVTEYYRKRYKNNREESLKYSRDWRRKNRDKVNRAQAERDAARRSKPKGKLECAISNGIRNSLASGAKSKRKWESLVGYTTEELMLHLEKQFLPDMTWENYGRDGWHVDHRIPKSLFNYETPDDIDFKKCWALENLQPLWQADNLRKHNKHDGCFQPSLTLAIK